MTTGTDPAHSAPPRQGRGAILDLQRKIAAHMDEGATVADVKRDILDVSPLEEPHRAALWLYAFGHSGHRATPARALGGTRAVSP